MLRFGRAAHNCIRNSNPDRRMYFPEVLIIHDAPPDNREERQKQRGQMNVKQLLADIDKNAKDTRAYFYLGNTYLEMKDFNKAIAAYDKYAEISKAETEELYQAYFHKGLCHKELKQRKEMKECYFKAIRTDCARRDAYIAMQRESFINLL